MQFRVDSATGQNWKIQNFTGMTNQYTPLSIYGRFFVFDVPGGTSVYAPTITVTFFNPESANQKINFRFQKLFLFDTATNIFDLQT